MKALVGIDESGAYESVLCLLGRMRIPKAEFVLEHVMAPLPLVGPPFMVGSDSTQQYIAALETAGRTLLDAAFDNGCIRDMHCKKRLVIGSPANALIADARDQVSDLIAVTATHQGRWGSSFLGSVSRAITISAPCSVLIAKGEMKPGAPVSIVLATDLSEYSVKCARELIKFSGEGISHVHLMTALHMSDSDKKILARVAPNLDYKLVYKNAEQELEALADELADAGIQTSWTVHEGNPDACIRVAMQNQKADLLAIGAQGKGFFEHLLVGSVALHQVMSEPYPVLMLRPRA